MMFGFEDSIFQISDNQFKIQHFRFQIQKRLLGGSPKKGSPSIIGGTCRFDSKIRVFWEMSDFVSAYVERNKNIFRKIEICQKLPSFFAEKWRDLTDCVASD